MKITGKNGIGELLKNILQVCFYGGIIILIILLFIILKNKIFGKM